MPTSQATTSKMPTTPSLARRRFELMAAEYVAQIGARIRDRREELGLTQRELADAIPGKADSNQVSKWERGTHKPSDQTLEHIAKTLKVDGVAYFLLRPPTTQLPDLLGQMEGSQMDRIEAKLDLLLRGSGVTPRNATGDPRSRGERGDEVAVAGEAALVQHPILRVLEGDALSADDAAWASIADAIDRALRLPGLSDACACRLLEAQRSCRLAAGLVPEQSPTSPVTPSVAVSTHHRTD